MGVMEGWEREREKENEGMAREVDVRSRRVESVEGGSVASLMSRRQAKHAEMTCCVGDETRASTKCPHIRRGRV